MNSTDFLNWTLGSIDDKEVDLILDQRYFNNKIEYLVKWIKEGKVDSWEDSSNLVCIEKIIQFWEKKNPQPIINLEEKNKNQKSFTIPEKIQFIGIDSSKTPNYVKIKLPGEDIKSVSLDFIKQNYSVQFIQYLE